jgi:peptide/nickel transport system permease protein
MSGPVQEQGPADRVSPPKRRSARTPLSVLLALGVLAGLILSALLAPFIAPFDPTDARSFDLMNARLPPAFMEGGDFRYLLGTDNQGRDLLSAMLYGMRVSIFIGCASVLVATSVGVVLGLLAGFLGGWVSTLIMRIADVILSLPTILVALLIAGMARVFIPSDSAQWAAIILVAAIATSDWVQYARTVRASTMVEAAKDYVRAAKVIGLPPSRIMARHILPNVMNSVLVLGTINFAGAILMEAALSFLGVGMPPTYPSLGTLVRIGNDFVFAGIWWIAVFPAVVLVVLVLVVNVVGDYLRDYLNPKLGAR